jgi:osmotically-inducible protein OsmY
VDERAFVDALTRALEVAGIYVAVELRDGTIALSGEISTRQERDAALDIAGAVAGARGLTVDDGLELIPTFPDSAFGDFGNADHGAFGYLVADRDHDLRLDPGLEDEPDFAGDVGTRDAAEATAEAIPYFPSTDPVIWTTTDGLGHSAVVGSGAISLDPDQRETAWEWRRTDADVEQDVRRELREDALTTDLQIDVEAHRGVVYIRGTVPMLEDAENAESVASRVDGVKEVREELAIALLH